MLYTVSATHDDGHIRHLFCEAAVAWQHVQDFKQKNFRDITIIDQTERLVPENELQARTAGLAAIKM
jgi:hypothetical protein